MTQLCILPTNLVLTVLCIRWQLLLLLPWLLYSSIFSPLLASFTMHSRLGLFFSLMFGCWTTISFLILGLLMLTLKWQCLFALFYWLFGIVRIWYFWASLLLQGWLFNLDTLLPNLTLFRRRPITFFGLVLSSFLYTERAHGSLEKCSSMRISMEHRHRHLQHNHLN